MQMLKEPEMGDNTEYILKIIQTMKKQQIQCMFSQIQFMEKSSQINIIDLDKEIRPAKRIGQFLENTKKNWSNFVK